MIPYSMFKRLLAVLMAVALPTIVATNACATMPPLTPLPAPISLAACQKWAAAQSEDAFDIWGLQENGRSSHDVALLRLALSCLGDKQAEIVGFGSSVGFDAAYCAKHSEAAICNANKSATGSSGFVFSGDRAFQVSNTNEGVRRFEKLNISALKRRFSSYSIRVAKGEDCLVCATISGPGGALEINYDRGGSTITSIASYDSKSRDALGNGIGGSLMKALGTNVATCDSGMNLTCASPLLKGLSYIVADDEKCTITVSEEKKQSDVPACARIAGFEIQ
jgi:hypothetical protein